MKIKITEPGIYNAEGVEIPVGTELDVKSEPTGWAGRYTVLSDGKGGKAGVTNPAKFTAKAKGDAWVIVDGKGKEVGKPISEDDAKAFNDLSDQDKSDFAAEHAKA